MSSSPPGDPMAFFRSLVGQWEKMANDFGSEAMKRPEAAQAMHGATSLSLQAQQAAHDWMAKALSAANMPSKAEVEALGARLTAIEATLARIEAAVAPSLAGTKPMPKRTRKPE